jgi:hypothetical protein
MHDGRLLMFHGTIGAHRRNALCFKGFKSSPAALSIAWFPDCSFFHRQNIGFMSAQNPLR